MILFGPAAERVFFSWPRPIEFSDAGGGGVVFSTGHLFHDPSNNIRLLLPAFILTDHDVSPILFLPFENTVFRGRGDSGGTSGGMQGGCFEKFRHIRK